MKAVGVTPTVKESAALLDLPDPQVDQQGVLVKVVRAGVCGTDREISEGMYGETPIGSDYLIIGHEALGQIVELGAKTTDLAVGDYVVASVRRPCPQDSCQPCRDGQNDMCSTGQYQERGIKGQHGYWAEYFSEHQQWLTKIPSEIEGIGVFLEPLSIVEKAMRHTQMIQERRPWPINNALVLGAGTVGLMAVMLLRMQGINTYVLDRSEAGGLKSRLISRLGAHHIDSQQTTLADFAAGAEPIDLVLEATGYAPLIFETLQHLAMNGLFCLLGVSGASHIISLDASQFNNQLVLGNQLVFGSVNANLIDFKSGVAHLEDIQQRWPGLLESMLTRRVPFSQYQDVFERQPDDIKVVIEMDR